MERLNRTIPARILRVNHGGEHGAIRIYRAQIATARVRCPDLLPFLEEALGHEREHLAAFRALMPARQSKPCRLMWIWGMGGAVLGTLTGLIGRGAIVACTVAVERTVHRHLDDQLAYLRPRDSELAAVIGVIQRQEQEHIEEAARRGKSARWLESTISALTDGLIFLSTRGDSAKLARELAP